ncbi:hypothetical protein AK812_SmicGene7996 [Symbiodinium microadriaticum]|uniref:Uncharacterized protein n=1 Tax=Symbiodinium microadriaticum TaxID=2951 RepID=A0A1Q9EM53_SYMMI|nr:hypothetical protein AK812_SmicGene7996 [Symbiodinium microadriaticum]
MTNQFLNPEYSIAGLLLFVLWHHCHPTVVATSAIVSTCNWFHVLVLLLPQADQKQTSGGFWQGVRGGLKHVGNALNHAGKLNQVDHPLSLGGLAQARQLKQQIAALSKDAQAPGSALLRCRPALYL